jgi:hypothetical protein
MSLADDVRQTKQALEREGVFVTSAALHARIGYGSLHDIRRILRALVSAQPPAPGTPDVRPTLALPCDPPALLSLIGHAQQIHYEMHHGHHFHGHEGCRLCGALDKAVTLATRAVQAWQGAPNAR